MTDLPSVTMYMVLPPDGPEAAMEAIYAAEHQDYPVFDLFLISHIQAEQLRATNLALSHVETEWVYRLDPAKPLTDSLALRRTMETALDGVLLDGVERTEDAMERLA